MGTDTAEARFDGAVDFSRLYRGFSCPQEGIDERFVEDVTVEYGQEIVRRFLDRFGENLGPGLTDYVGAWTEQGGDYETAWHLSFGEVRKAMLPGHPADERVRAAMLALQLTARGIAGRWRLDLGRPAALFCGNWLLPEAEAIEVDSDGTHAHVRLTTPQGRSQGMLTRGATGWTGDRGHALAQFGPLPNRISVLPPPAVVTPGFDELRPMLAHDVDAAMAAACQRALDLIAAHAPIYRRWVERVIRHIIPLRFEKSLIRSGSDAGQPGVIHMSYDERAIVLAEMLVHEGTHQYMNLLCRLGDIDDGSDTKLYYSPVRRTDRPLSAIVVAYHAFANVLLLYRLCQQSGADDGGYCTTEEVKLIPQLRELEQVLTQADALTDIGRALYEPLVPRIA